MSWRTGHILETNDLPFFQNAIVTVIELNYGAIHFSSQQKNDHRYVGEIILMGTMVCQSIIQVIFYQVQT